MIKYDLHTKTHKEGGIHMRDEKGNSICICKAQYECTDFVKIYITHLHSEPTLECVSVKQNQSKYNFCFGEKQ